MCYQYAASPNKIQAASTVFWTFPIIPYVGNAHLLFTQNG